MVPDIAGCPINRVEFIRSQLLPSVQAKSIGEDGKIIPGLLDELTDSLEFYGETRDKAILSRILHDVGGMFVQHFSNPNKATITVLHFGLDKDPDFLALCEQAGVLLPESERFKEFRLCVDMAGEISSRIPEKWMAESFRNEMARVAFQHYLQYPQSYSDLNKAKDQVHNTISRLFPDVPCPA